MTRDERGRFVSPKDELCYCITVWRIWDGDIEQKLWEASERDLDRIEAQYKDEPEYEIQVEDLAP